MPFIFIGDESINLFVSFEVKFTNNQIKSSTYTPIIHTKLFPSEIFITSNSLGVLYNIDE